MAQQQAQQVQRFRPTNGRVTGYLSLAVCVLVAASLVAYAAPATVVRGLLACALAAVLVWMAMLRPQVSATTEVLRLRTFAENVAIPLASIDTVVVRRYLLVRSGGRKYICPAISRPLRRTVRTEMKWGGQQFMQPGVSEERISGGKVQADVKGRTDMPYPDFVEERILGLAADDRARRGIAERSEEEYELGSSVVRRPAVPELAALAVLLVALVVSLVD